METNTAQQLLELIERETGVPATEHTPIDALGIDSLDFIALIQCIRQEIGPISLDAATSSQTVGELMGAVKL